MEQSDLLRYLTEALEALQLRYFITGSTATIFYGEPRLTNDIDVVVDLPGSRINDFCLRFPAPDFYVSESAVREAVSRRGQFNIIHPTSGLKVDVIVPEPSAFNESRFSRRRKVSADVGLEAQFASPEDAIIKKMEYFREGGSEKHLRDITGVLKASRQDLDLTYISRWAALLGLGEIWAMIQRRSI
jgi:hypothetical protein